MTKKISVAVLPGDGIGKEVMPYALQALGIVEELDGSLQFEFKEFDWGTEYYVKHNRMMPENAIQILSGFDCILLGAVGMPNVVADHVSLWGMLIPIRREFDQYINLRPARRLPGLPCPLATDKTFDFLVVRENSEGEYSNVGGRFGAGDKEMAMQTAIFTRSGVERAMEYAFQLAKTRSQRVTSATKSNGIVFSMPFWDEVFRAVSQRHPEVQTVSRHIDALAASFVTHPHELDVVVASNLFGDILTDLASALMGSIGIGPSANINPEQKYPSMFEPVHGSAPDIVGRGLANPTAMIWTAKMLLDWLHEESWGELLLNSIEATTSAGIVTCDVGGSATTNEVAMAILEDFKARAAAAIS